MEEFAGSILKCLEQTNKIRSCSKEISKVNTSGSVDTMEQNSTACFSLALLMINLLLEVRIQLESTSRSQLL